MTGFPREERLKEKLLIAALFAKSKSISDFPVRLIWFENQFPVQGKIKVLFSVPKKRVKRAVDRNRIKRKMREVYRLNRETLHNVLSEKGRSLILGFIFMGDTATPAKEIESKIILTLHRLEELHVKTL